MTDSAPGGHGTVSLRLVQPFTRVLATRGVDPAKLLAGLPIGPEEFADPDGRITHEVSMRLLERAVEASGDDALGIHAAEALRPGDFDALEYAARSSSTVRSALETVGRYIRLMHEAAACTLTREPEGEVWTLSLPVSHPRVAVEYALAALVLTGRFVTGRDYSPRAVQLAFPRPADTREQERVFGASIEWSAPRTALVFDPALVDRSLASANPALTAAIHQHAEQLLAELSSSRRFVTRVREHVIAVLQAGEPGAEDVARRLRTSERTLRRRLQEQGTTYTDVLSDVRRELALRYLGDAGISVAEIAFLLGFSNASAFHRAFRRWTGMTPLDHRRKLSG